MSKPIPSITAYTTKRPTCFGSRNPNKTAPPESSNSHTASTTHPCQAQGSPQPQPYLLARNHTVRSFLCMMLISCRTTDFKHRRTTVFENQRLYGQIECAIGGCLQGIVRPRFHILSLGSHTKHVRPASPKISDITTNDVVDSNKNSGLSAVIGPGTSTR